MKSKIVVSAILCLFLATGGIFAACAGHSHEYRQTVVAATCVSEGYTLYECECGDSYREDVTPALGHLYGYDRIDWQWEGSGATATVTCTREGCGEDTQGHTLTYTADISARTILQPTCLSEGKRELTASITVDGNVYTAPEKKTETMEKAAHTPVGDDNAVAATCTETGLTESTSCRVCGTLIEAQQVIEKLPHTPVGDGNAVAATCTETGLTESKSCSVCGELIEAQQVIEKIPHTPVGDGNAVAATCTETGLTESKSCSVCGELIEAQQVIEKIPHTPVGDGNAVAATCTETGLTESKSCSVCGELIEAQQTISPLGHAEVTDPERAATCTQTGLTEGSHCSRCGETLIAQTVVPALGHISVADAAVAATCTQTGLTEGSHCSRCGETLIAQTVVPAQGHRPVVDAAVAATCTQTGLTEGSHCSVCERVLREQSVLPMLPHDFSGNRLRCALCDEAYNPDFIAISDATQLKNISSDLDGYYYLAQDIELSSTTMSPIGYGVGAFTGIFDGDGKSISYYTYTVENNGQKTNVKAGLFETNAGIIRNLTMVHGIFKNAFNEWAENSRNPEYGNVTGVYGTFAAVNDGTIENCTLKGTVTMQISRRIEKYFASISAGSYDETDRSDITFGGFVGINNGKIADCSNEAAVTITIEGFTQSMYGLFGFNNSNTWSVIITGDMGGLAGTNNGEISHCNVNGIIEVKSVLKAVCKKNGTSGAYCVVQNSANVGTLVGYNTSSGSVSDCASVKIKIGTSHSTEGVTSRTKINYNMRNDGANGFYGINEGQFEGNTLQ